MEIWPTARPGSDQPVDYLLPARMLEWAGAELRYLEGVAGRGLGASLVLESDDGAEHVTAEAIVGYGLVALWRAIGIDDPPRPELAAVHDGPPRELDARDRLGSYYEIGPGTLDALGIRALRGRHLTAETARGHLPSLWSAVGPRRSGGLSRIRSDIA
ncbi:MAG TPA: hypothetical protein VFQ22_08120 [Longimicrobiales bacterium]|nr:hypothetical protein [Longimicrobiales bacterium]